MKIVMVAGGSGGHIYPALSLAEELEKRGHDITFVGSNDRMEKDVIPAHNFKYIGLDVYTTRGGLFQKIKSLLSIESAYKKCLKLLSGFDMAIGFGNYISIPVMQAAIKLKMKTIIHEQNSFVGRANRMLEENVGYMIYFFEKACAISGYVLGVNPFNQPGVESYKANMFALLGKPGYEGAKAELEAKLG